MAPTERVRGMTWVIEPELGGRWRSIRGPARREWLAERLAARPAREAVSPGEPFVDLGGLEECFPTLAGALDHGDAWDRPWAEIGDGWLGLDGEDYRLARRVTATGDAVTADYRLEAEPGFRFVWAGHASIDVSEAARLIAPERHRTRLWVEHWRTWPDLDVREGRWPAPAGTEMESLATDGTANFCMLLGLPAITVQDSDAAITFALDAPGQPVAMAVWRNLGGWPPKAPYRGIAIEPAIGWHFDRDQAGPGEAGIVPAGGEVSWRLTISATD